jgi:hypothetical protein
MKKFLSFIIVCSFVVFGYQSYASSNCSCQPGYTKCTADGGLMSCCTCCQPGSSCGGWTAFGLAGCSCESTGTTKAHGYSNQSNLSTYMTAFASFTVHLNRNGMNTDNINNALNEMTAGLDIEKDPIRGDIVHPTAERATKFSEVYFAEIERFRSDETNKKIIDEYLLTIQPK